MVCAVSVLVVTADETAEKTFKPNMIFIMADDLGVGDLGCYGAKLVKTPNLDKLAGGGMRFTDAHAPHSVCTPTRYAVLTGRYAWRGRLKAKVLWSGYEPQLVEKGRKTIGHIMQELGYHTAHIGKWHLGWGDKGTKIDFTAGELPRGPRELGFEYSFVTASAKNMYPLCFVENQKAVGKLVPSPLPETNFDKKNCHGPRLVAEGFDVGGVDIVYAEKTINFLKMHHAKTPNKPFYVHLMLETPHKPNVVPPEFKGKSGLSPRSDQLLVMDHVVGKVLDAVDKLGYTQNTMIMFTSDNGAELDGEARRKGHLTNGEFNGGKRSQYEGGHRVPFIVRWPERIKPGTTNGALICLSDMMATYAAITGYKLTNDMGEDSLNILPHFFGSEKAIRTSIIHQDIRGALGIRNDKWKYIQAAGKTKIPNGKKFALFNMESDWRESTNLGDKHPEIVSSLRTLLKKQKNNGRTAPNRD